MWAIWLEADEYRKKHPGTKYSEKEQWVADSDDAVPQFPRPDDALAWLETWLPEGTLEYYSIRMKGG